MLDLNALHLFLVVIESGSFSAAGRRQHLSQSAVSQAINGLERSIGVDLFERQGRRVHLTEAGQFLAPMARELLVSAQRIEESIASLQKEVFGEITIGCSTTSGKYLLPGLIARFRAHYPRVRINVSISSRETVLANLIGGKIPLGVSSKLVEHQNLEYRSFFTDDVILIVHPDHRWAKFGSIYPDDLLEEPLIQREESSGTYEVITKGLLSQDISPEMLNVVMSLGNAEAIEMAVEEGIGAAFISRLAAARGLALGRVKQVNVVGMTLQREIFLARNLRIAPPRSQKEFWEFVTVSQGYIDRFVYLQNQIPTHS